MDSKRLGKWLIYYTLKIDITITNDTELSTVTLNDFEAFMDVTGFASEEDWSADKTPAVMAEFEAVLV